ncbi:hypothetical protein G7Y89_g7446 [Cudoniella acicularis]|uniref:Uncharacterized protein n=1 Tax=Cudoniella acicularis TaxID=354080 RepID=A0A8H4RKX4_9HELO|nr:hypothetical protein G7Y89_g7446 [Cudoniella acicularis]
MKLSIFSAILVLTAPLAANATTIEARGTAVHVETKQEYDLTTNYMREAGQCRAYTSHKKNGFFTCDKRLQCPTSSREDRRSCRQKYHIGECQRNVKVIDFAIGTVVVALPDIAAITCMAWLKAGEELFKVAKAAVGMVLIPAAKRISMTAKLAAQAAKKVKKEGKRKEDYLSWYSSCTQPGRHDYESEASQAFDSAMKVPDEILNIFG